MLPSGNWVSARVILGFMAREAIVVWQGLVDPATDVHRSRPRKNPDLLAGVFGFISDGLKEAEAS